MSANEISQGNTLELVAPYLINSVEKTAELQKQYLGVAAGQLKQLIAFNKRVVSFVPTPLTYVFDVAERSIQKGVQVQSSLIDAAVEQSQAAVRISGLKDLSAISQELTSLVRKSLEQATATHKEVLDFALDETQKAAAFAGKEIAPAATSVKIAPAATSVVVTPAEPVVATPAVVKPAEVAVAEAALAKDTASQNFKKNLGAIMDVQQTIVDVAVKPHKSQKK